jgi:ribosomal protein L7/L12
MTKLTEADVEAVKCLIEEDEKVKAIKLVKGITDYGLKKAKNYVDELQSEYMKELSKEYFEAETETVEPTKGEKEMEYNLEELARAMVEVERELIDIKDKIQQLINPDRDPRFVRVDWSGIRRLGGGQLK